MDHGQAVEDQIAAYRAREPYKIITNAGGNEQLHITEQPPIEIAVLAGEILYQLRSALDHLFFEVVRRAHPGPMSKGLIKACHFPILTKSPTGFNPPIPKDKLFPRGELYRWVPDPAYTFIEGWQPYYGVHDRRKLLGMLHEFSNIDKHRRLNTVVTLIDRKDTRVFAGGFSSTAITPFLNHGAELMEPWHPVLDAGPTPVDVKREFIPMVAFDEPELGPPQTALIDEVIHELPLVVFTIRIGFQQFLD